MRDRTTQRLARTALVAAIYAVVTWAIAPFAYGSLQFRISEVMVLLAFFDPFYIGGLTLGCFIANILGPNGIIDAVIGTGATFVSLVAINLTAKLLKRGKLSLIIASLWPTIFNGIFIGLELTYFFKVPVPLIVSMLQVAFGEFVVVTIIGVPVFTLIKKRYLNLIRV